MLSQVDLAYRRFDGPVPAEVMDAAREADADRAAWLLKHPEAAYREAVGNAEHNRDSALRLIDGIDEYINGMEVGQTSIDWTDHLGIRHVGHVNGLRKERAGEVLRLIACVRQLATLHRDFAEQMERVA